jgi:VWFA-related protein
VILVSLLSTAPEDRSLARQQLIKFMEQKPAGSRFAIFTYGNSVLRLRQGLTDDKDKLLEALNRKSTKPKQPSAGEVRVNSDPVYKWDDPFDALTDVVRQVADIPGRKNLIWLSDGFSDATPAFTGNLLLQNRIAVYTIKTKAAKTTKSQISTSDCETEFDPGYDPNVGVPEGLNMGPAAARAPSVTSTCASPPVWNFGSNKGDLAKNSGGQAFTGTDNIDVAINRAIADSSNYYTIGYVPTNAKYVGKARKIKVVLANNGYRLLYRQSY